MAIRNEGNYAGEFIFSEANGNRSRDTVVIETGLVLGPGTVLGKVSASGKYRAYDDAGTDGEEVAVGVLYAKVDATDGDKKAVAVVRDAEVIESLLVGVDANAKSDLEAVGIISR